jgi:small-conductance mechanosensitive channel
LILIGERYRARYPKWHRRLGRFQVACVLLLVTPSGLAMAYHAAAGPIAAVGLAALAVATATCVSLGARSAITRRFADHRRWMWRTYILLCSAIVLRLIGGLATVTGMTAPWVDPLATWMCWLLPLTAFELREWTRRRSAVFALDRTRAQATPRRQEAPVH